MKHDRLAFTLIELVISALLTSIMMVALLSVLWSSLRQGTMLDKNKVGQFPMTSVAEQLRIDFQNARAYSVDTRGVSIAGFLGSDIETGIASFTPAVVRYETVALGEQLVLVRRDLTRGTAGTEVVRLGVGAIQFQSLVESLDGEVAQVFQPGFKPMPAQFRLGLIAQNGGILFREVIHHHDE